MTTPQEFVVAVVGATGAVGEVMLSVLHERKFPIKQLILLASERSAGKKLDFGNHKITVQDLATFDPSGVDIALFSAGGSTSKEYAPKFAAAGATRAKRYARCAPPAATAVQVVALLFPAAMIEIQVTAVLP